MAKAKKAIIKIIPDETIIRKIYVVKGQKVMLDFDLAALYNVETRVFNQAVKRNLDRFPEDFMFQLTPAEWKSMMSQIVISSESDGTKANRNMMSQTVISSQKRRKLSSPPFAFTEHGVTMLATVLKSERAVKMSIAVVRAFIELKKMATSYSEIARKLALLEDRLGEHDVQLGAIHDAIENLLDDKVEEKVKTKAWEERERIGFTK
jgi:phage regulator Rha-like protein